MIFVHFRYTEISWHLSIQLRTFFFKINLEVWLEGRVLSCQSTDILSCGCWWRKTTLAWSAMSTPGMLKSPTDWLGERSPHRTIRKNMEKIWKNHDTSDITPPSLGTLSRSIMLQSQGVAFGKPTFHNIRHVHTRCLPSTSINIHQHPSTVNFAIFPLVNSHNNYGKIHHIFPYFAWENPLFWLGHVQ